MKSSDLFVKCLENEEVEYIFGVPGEENEDIMISLINSKIKFIPTRHEQGAAFMATEEVSKQLNAFVEERGIPIVHTQMGKGAISDKSEYSLFTTGIHAKDYYVCC